MAEIVLATLNAKFIHSAFGLRYLQANLGDLKSSSRILEFEITQRPIDIAERILLENPRIVGLGVYIWNVSPTTELVALLKKLRPELKIILGGPEVSYESDQQAVVRLADCVISGEADLEFELVCSGILREHRVPVKLVAARLPDLKRVALPYDLYGPSDLAHRIIYVEASRGCPFSCEFCLSSLDIPVRQFPLDAFLGAARSLIDRGAMHLKFVDRTFNLAANTGSEILQFLLSRYQPGMFFHFEMIPDRLPQGLRDVIGQFPPGALQFEVGIQTFDPEVATRISRRQNYVSLEENLRFLREKTGVHLHADLIAGLPGETLEGFARGFDKLLTLEPQEIQVGILKRLRGTPIARHDQEWQMAYNPSPPYEILQTKVLSFNEVQRLRRFARYWDMIGNSGRFPNTLKLLFTAPLTTELGDQANGDRPLYRPLSSPFWRFMWLSDWLYHRAGRTDAISLNRLMELVHDFLIQEAHESQAAAAAAMGEDYKRSGHRDKPSFLKDPAEKIEGSRKVSIPARQARHLRQ